ncbi:MAG: hypothetical protein LBL27_01490, partial [Coriobacteriales bacterium]|nr:hypothetical protein [Coriobacteriales bacterium]
ESQIAEEDIPRLEALLEQVTRAQESLDGAIGKAEQAKETFFEDERQELAQHAQDAAAYRKQMLDLSSQLIGYDVAAMTSALSLERAWTLIVDADADMRSAVEVVAENGTRSVAESRDYNQSALDKFALAQEALTAATDAFANVETKALSDYLSAKTASAELALASDQAFLDGDRATATAKNKEFVTKDAEAVELAAAFPTEPLNLVVAAYEEATKQIREDYKIVRSQAADVDVYLRAYLGVSVQ